MILTENGGSKALGFKNGLGRDRQGAVGECRRLRAAAQVAVEEPGG
jgi:hypothetical protein